MRESPKRKKQKIEEEKIDESKRAFLRGAVALGATAAVFGPPIIKALREKNKDEDERSEDTLTDEDRSIRPPEEFDESFLKVEKKPRPYEMGRLAKWRFGNLLSRYTIGEERQVRAVEQIDFRYQLAELWKAKLERVKKRKPQYYQANFNAAKTIFTSFDPEKTTKTTLSAYRDQAQRSINSVRGDMDLQQITKLAAFKNFKPSQLKLLQTLESRINGDAMIAYVATELMPTGLEGNAEIGIATLDFLLRNAGTEFVDRIPAIHDERVSVGPYQFTSGALFDNGKERRGASLLHRITNKKQHIPQGVVGLQGESHHKAGYLFAVYNLAMLVRRLGEKGSTQVLEIVNELPRDLVTEYIASAHNKPGNARSAFEDYIRDYRKFRGMSEEERKKTKTTEPDFVDYCEGNKVGDYCTKTRDNIRALREYRH